jgi:hypothetical protein
MNLARYAFRLCFAEQVKGVQHCSADGALAMQGVEDRYAVRAALAIERERPHLQSRCRARNRRERALRS